MSLRGFLEYLSGTCGHRDIIPSHSLWCCWPLLLPPRVVPASALRNPEAGRSFCTISWGWQSPSARANLVSKTGFLLQGGAPDSGGNFWAPSTKSKRVLVLPQRKLLSWWWTGDGVMPNPCGRLGLESLFWRRAFQPKSKKRGRYCFAYISESLLLDTSFKANRIGCWCLKMKFHLCWISEIEAIWSAFKSTA